MQTLPDLLTGHRGARLTARVGCFGPVAPSRRAGQGVVSPVEEFSQILRGPEQGAQVTASLRTLAARASHGQLGPRVLSDACLISRCR